MHKLTIRSIRSFPGRYIALVLIVALGAGFFAGLKITQDAMVSTAQGYYDRQEFYDFRVFSTVGFTPEEVEQIAALEGVKHAEGSSSLDIMAQVQGKVQPFRMLGIPESVNKPSLVCGRWPEQDNECLADNATFTEEDIGSSIMLTEDQKKETLESLSCQEYTVVGLADSPLYLSRDRGTTDIGSGTIYAFAYIPQSAFTQEAWTEVNITLENTGRLYSGAYEKLIDGKREEITLLCERLSWERYDGLLSQLEASPAMAVTGLSVAQLAEKVGLREPETYVLTRDENPGYVSFENDTAIISGIANVFPLFFILIAMLVCSATMSRMVEEERTQIGVLKALGYGSGALMSKYLLYAGSATLLGWTVGYFLCTWGLPQIFWYAFSTIYDFAPMIYLFSPSLAAITLLASLVCILGSAALSCRRALTESSAQLIRPRAAQSGKRIRLERWEALWNRLSFLQKITLRNMFRYKRRMFMMLLGVGCCAALVLTGFGARDSMIDIGRRQYEDIQTYELEASFADMDEEKLTGEIKALTGVQAAMKTVSHYVDLHGDAVLNAVVLMAFPEQEKAGDFWHFRQGNTALPYPEDGEALINGKTAETLGLSPGDQIEISTADMQRMKVRISGVFDNFIGNYILISPESCGELYGSCRPNTVMIRAEGDPEQLARRLTEIPGITGVTQLSLTEKSVTDALSCLNYIIWLIVLFSGALAFVVIYNLTIINIGERNREIATVQVLGFFPRETESYVLKENLILSVLAAIFGLPLGTIFHRIVMRMINVKALAFDIHITPISYVLAFLCTVVFALIVSGRMKKQVDRINMTESLKAVE